MGRHPALNPSPPPGSGTPVPLPGVPPATRKPLFRWRDAVGLAILLLVVFPLVLHSCRLVSRSSDEGRQSDPASRESGIDEVSAIPQRAHWADRVIVVAAPGRPRVRGQGPHRHHWPPAGGVRPRYGRVHGALGRWGRDVGGVHGGAGLRRAGQRRIGRGRVDLAGRAAGTGRVPQHRHWRGQACRAPGDGEVLEHAGGRRVAGRVRGGSPDRLLRCGRDLCRGLRRGALADLHAGRRRVLGRGRARVAGRPDVGRGHRVLPRRR